MSYTPPSVTEIGTLRDDTLQTFNKVGGTPDVFTAITGGVVVGSLVTP